MMKNKKKFNPFCQECKRKLTKEELSANLEIEGKKVKLCEGCAEQAKSDEEYANLPLCHYCHRPLRDEDAMPLKNGGLIHEACYDGRDGP